MLKEEEGYLFVLIKVIQEFPKSNQLYEKLQKEDIVFIYIGIDKKKRAWENGVEKYQLNGQNYYLNEVQSRVIGAAIGMVSNPFYLLIDKAGIIIEKGSQIRPSKEGTLGKINSLLAEE